MGMDVSDSLGGGGASPELLTPPLWLSLANTGLKRFESLSPYRLEEQLASQFSVRTEHVRFFFCLFAGYPLGLVYHVLIEPLERRTSRLLYIALTGYALLLYMFGSAAVHPLITVFTVHSVVTYFRGRVAVFITFVFTMTYLTYLYWTTSSSRDGRDYAVNVCLPQCVLTLRLIGVAFDLLDGERISQMQKKNDASGTADAEREKHPDALSAPPPLLELLAYVFFFSGSLAGPQFSMRRFQRFASRELIPRELQSGAGIVPDCVLIGLNRVVIGALHILLYLCGTHFLPDRYLLSEEFNGLSMWLKICYLLLWGKVFVYKYTMVWLLQEGGCIVSGLAYSGPGASETSKVRPGASNGHVAESRAQATRFNTKDLEAQSCWQGCTNVHVLQLEMTASCSDVIDSFNVSTNRWIATYVYKRLRWLGSRPLSHIISLLFLAIWHGLESGYLLAFLYEFFMVSTERLVQTIVRSDARVARMFEKAGVRLALWPLKKALILYAGATMYVVFNFLHFKLYWKVLESVKFSGFYHLPAIPVFLLIITLCATLKS